MKRLQVLWRQNQSRLPTAEQLSPEQLDRVTLNPPLVEVKHRVAKTSQTFSLENWNGNWLTHTHRQSQSQSQSQSPLQLKQKRKQKPGRSCVGRFVTPPDTPGSSSNHYGAPVNSYSWGVWADSGLLRNIGAYRMHDSFGNLLAYRLDILKDVVIKCSVSDCPPLVQHSDRDRDWECDSDRIVFQDLIVDCWLWPDLKGRVSGQDLTVEDLFELNQALLETPADHTNTTPTNSGGSNSKGGSAVAGQQMLREEDAVLVNDTLWTILAEPQAVATAVDMAIEEAKARWH